MDTPLPLQYTRQNSCDETTARGLSAEGKMP
jgi:hypothetical protein